MWLQNIAPWGVYYDRFPLDCVLIGLVSFFFGGGELFLTGCRLKHFWLPQVRVNVVYPRRWKVIFKSKFLHTDKLFLHQLFIRLMLKSETFYPTLGGICQLTDTATM